MSSALILLPEYMLSAFGNQRTQSDPLRRGNADPKGCGHNSAERKENMAYESRIYIVKKTTLADGNGNKVWAEIIAKFNMCRYPNLADFMRSKLATDCYIYADDGNTPIIEDCYGEPLTEASIADVVAVLEDDIANGDDYRRIFPLLATLKALDEHKDKWESIAVLHCGY